MLKVKIGNRITSLVCDRDVYKTVLPKQEVKAMVSGMYVLSAKRVRGPQVEAKKVGKDGKVKITYDAEGEIIDEEIIEEAIPGATVVSTLDMDLQRVTYNALEKQILNLRNTAEAGKGKESEGGKALPPSSAVGKRQDPLCHESQIHL